MKNEIKEESQSNCTTLKTYSFCLLDYLFFIDKLAQHT